MISSSLNLLFLMSAILLLSGLDFLYAGTAGGEQVTASRSRRTSNSQRSPGTVGILVRVPTVADTTSDDALMWQRLLCVPAPAVSHTLRRCGP